MKTLIIDNYDSFTFNLYQLIANVNGDEPLVVRNDQLGWSQLQDLEFDNIVISPGPGRPEHEHDFGICRDALLTARVPTLGVCLGHQGLAHLYGGTVTHAPEVMHGRLSEVYHNGAPIFKGIPQPFTVVRYHSLIVADDLPTSLEKTAWTADGIVMGIQHRALPLWGVQFHPESICSEYGYQLLQNFRDLTRQHGTNRAGRRSWSGFSTIPKGQQRAAAQRNVEVCWRKLDTWHDPERVFVNLLADQPVAFWLDSSRAEPGLSRFSFMGTNDGPLSRLVSYRIGSQELTVTTAAGTRRSHESIFDYLDRELRQLACRADDLPFDFNCGFVGYFGYELKAECGGNLAHPSPLPDATFILSDRLIAFDHQERSCYLVSLVRKDDSAEARRWFDTIEQQLRQLRPLPPLRYGNQQEPIAFSLSRPYEVYLDDIRQCQAHIRNGESYEICLTNQLHTTAVAEPLTLYRTLRRINPAPYSALLRFDTISVISSSPERFLRIDRDGSVESKPIKGTLPRGKTLAEDAALSDSLRNDTKSRAENLMIVDLLRNDLGIVCEIGSVSVPKLMHVESYQTVHQLVSTVRGHLRRDLSPIDCIRQAFPGGSMTGAPKVRTMALLDDLEPEARGVYSGALGFLGLNSTSDLSIVIRTIVMTPTSTSIGVGGAIVALSDAEAEFDEILLKARAPLQAIVLAACGEAEADTYVIIGGREREQTALAAG
ncbi:MAG TPA: aminodeoxychorismate synthase component I [Herpetosiphonaceae bacterium]